MRTHRNSDLNSEAKETHQLNHDNYFKMESIFSVVYLFREAWAINEDGNRIFKVSMRRVDDLRFNILFNSISVSLGQ